MPSTIAHDAELEDFRRRINWRSEESFRHARQIIKPYGELDPILKWCKTELVDEWRWQMIDMASPARPGRYIFYFDGERDYVAFTMTWT